MTRSGSEPIRARSALRLRLTFALLGVVWGAGAAAGFAVADLPGWAGLCAFIALVAVGDVLVVRHRMRQGGRYQPGRDEPSEPPPEPSQPPDSGDAPGSADAPEVPERPTEARHSHGAARH